MMREPWEVLLVMLLVFAGYMIALGYHVWKWK